MKINEMISYTKWNELLGNDLSEIEGLNFCNRKSQKKTILSYATSEKYAQHVKQNKAILAIIVPIDVHDYDFIVEQRNGCVIYSENPEKSFYEIHEELCNRNDFYEKYDFPKIVGKNCNIHPSAVIDDGVIIGDNVTIGALSVVKAGSIIDNGVKIGSNSVIGSEGFQVLTFEEDEPMHITHKGRTHLCDNVCIGDCTCIGNSLFEGETYIGKGTKIDNLVYIAHNLFIGERAIICAGVKLCGSSVVEKGAWIAPNCSILNKVTIGEKAKIGLGSVVVRDVPANSLAYGVPAKIKGE